MIETYAKSLKKPGKGKNGDHSIVINADEFLFAVVADGITSQPCDWYASQLCCEKLGEILTKEIPQSNNWESLLETSLTTINEELILVAGDCEGLGSTISGILWQKRQDEVFCFWLGDSKIFLYKSSELHQLSIDDTEEVVLSKGLLPGEQVISKNYLTNSIGREDFRINIRKSVFEPGDQMVLATDGFVESFYSFTNQITKVLDSMNLESLVDAMFKENWADQTDDSTVVIIRRPVEFLDKEVYDYLSTSLDSYASISHRELNLVFFGLKRGIALEDEELCEGLLERIKSRNLKLGKEQLLELLNTVVKKNFNAKGLYQELVFLIRKS